MGLHAPALAADGTCDAERRTAGGSSLWYFLFLLLFFVFWNCRGKRIHEKRIKTFSSAAGAAGEAGGRSADEGT